MHSSSKTPKFFAFVALSLALSMTATSQVSDLVSSGGDLKDGTYVLESSIGQAFFNNEWKGKYYLSEGFQQHHEIAIFKDEDDVLFNIYPNPANEILQIECGNPLVKLNLYNFQGALIRSYNNINQLYYQLNVVDFASAKYFIELIDAKGIVSIQQLIKQ